PEYRLVNSTNAYSATGTNNKAMNWAAAIVTYKIKVPTVTSITRAGADPTNATSVNFTVTFSESVFQVDTADFALTTSGVSGASIANVSGSGTTYTVTVNTGTGTGTIRLDLVDNDSIVDIDAVPLGGTDPAGTTAGN